MSGLNLVESNLDPTKAIYSQVIPAGEPWIHALKKGQYFRIVVRVVVRRFKTECYRLLPEIDNAEVLTLLEAHESTVLRRE